VACENTSRWCSWQQKAPLAHVLQFHTNSPLAAAAAVHLGLRVADLVMIRARLCSGGR
jgi:hypothetical protein